LRAEPFDERLVPGAGVGECVDRGPIRVIRRVLKAGAARDEGLHDPDVAAPAALEERVVDVLLAGRGLTAEQFLHPRAVAERRGLP
jgi:hypothetical protein